MTKGESFVKRMLAPEKGEIGEAKNVERVVSPETESGDAVKPIEGEGGDIAQRESALEVALNYLQKESDEIERNPFSKGWAIKEGYGKDGKPNKPVKAKKVEKSAKDELIEALVEDAAPKGQTMEQHDRQHHHGHFDPSTQSCKFREKMAEETETDKADALDEGKEKTRNSKNTSSAEETQQQFSEDFWATIHPERGSSYSSEFGEDAGEQERKDMEAYKANFTKDGKYKVPFAGGKFSKGVMERARALRENGGNGVWSAESRADAEAAGRVLSNLLGGVSFELSDKPYEGGGESRKSISGIYTGSAAEYDKPSLLKVGTGEGSQVYGWGLYGSTERDVAEGYARQGRNLNVAAGDAEYELDGKALNRKDDVIDSALTYLSSERMNTQKAIVEINKAIDGLKKQLEDTTERLSWDKNNFLLQMDAESLPKRIRHLNEVREFIEHDGGRVRQVLPSENLYEQTFFTDREPRDESHLLKWYDPVPKTQKKWVVDALEKSVTDKFGLKEYSGFGTDDLSAIIGNAKDGKELYEIVADCLKFTEEWESSPKAASEFLVRAGIDGIKYPVDSYGGKSIKNGDEAGWNYVSFRDDNIRVDHKWVDGEQRYFKNSAGRVVGEYDRKTGKITLYPGAKIKDVVHEFSHGLWQFAEQEAKAGRTGLRDKLHQIAKSAPDAVKDAVGRKYYDQNPNVILEECFTHEMARRSEQNKAFARAISTARGKKWYQRAWGAIKETYAGLARKMGWDKADVGKMEKMDAHEAAEWILGQMAKGKRFGDVRPEPPEPDGDGGKSSKGKRDKKGNDGKRKSIIGEKGAANLGIGRLDEAKKMVEDGADRKEIWQKTGWWKGKDGKWRVEIPDLKNAFEMGDEDLLQEAEKEADRCIEKRDEIIKELNRQYNEIREDVKNRYGIEESNEFGLIARVNIEMAKPQYQGYRELKKEAERQWEKYKEARKRLRKLKSGKRDYCIGDFASGTPIEKAYPEILDIPVKIRGLKGRTAGFYDSEKNEIGIDSDNSPKEMMDIVVHELQHLIQKHEGFTRGTNQRMAGGIEGYRKTAGEVEARNTEKRLLMTPEERATIPPWETEDVPEEEQIVRDEMPARAALMKGLGEGS